MLTEIQVNNFFQQVLEFPNWKEMKETNQTEFLKQLVQKYQYHCYFHVRENQTKSNKIFLGILFFF
jgi:hypothetical protein